MQHWFNHLAEVIAATHPASPARRTVNLLRELFPTSEDLASSLVAAAAVFIGVGLLGWILTRIFSRILTQHRVIRTIRFATLAVAVYSAFGAYYRLYYLPLDQSIPAYETATYWMHRGFAAAMMLVSLRLFNWLVVVPVLSHGGKVPQSRFVQQIILAILYGFAILWYCQNFFGMNFSSVFTASAVVSIVLGLALQETLGNFFSGMVLQATRPFQIGDVIKCGDIEGVVADMTWRAVTVNTGDGNQAQIPNAQLSKERIINYHQPTKATLCTVSVRLGFDVSPEQATVVLLGAVPDSADVLKTPAPGVAMVEFGEFGVLYRLAFWCNEPGKRWGLENTARMTLWHRLKDAGLQIPVPARRVQVHGVPSGPEANLSVTLGNPEAAPDRV